MSLNAAVKKIHWPLVFIFFLAFFLRFYSLELKPPHHDEGVNGCFAEQVMQKGFYRYDPMNYHGPLHHYLSFFSQQLFGRSLWALRFPGALASGLLVCLMAAFGSLIGRRQAYWAAFFMAISPGFVYFGRHAIHETDLVLFSVMAVWGFWGLRLMGGRAPLWALAIGFAGMVLTKETFCFQIVAFAGCFLMLLLWEKLVPSASASGVVRKPDISALEQLAAAGTAVFLILFFYSGTFLNWKDVPTYVAAFANWTKTGLENKGHAKPFIYWTQVVLRYEYPVVAGFLASVAVLLVPARVPRIIRHLGAYGIAVFLAYSLIPYKTAWCVLNFLWPFYFPLAYVLDYFFEKKPDVVITLIVLLTISSLAVAADINYVRYAEPNEPYAYVQTNQEIWKLIKTLDKMVKLDPANYGMTGSVFRKDNWPLPWVLGPFKNVTWHERYGRPPVYDADFLIVNQVRGPEVEENLTKSYFVQTFNIMPGQMPAKIYFEAEKFKPCFPGANPQFVPKKKEMEPITGKGLTEKLSERIAADKTRPVYQKEARKIDRAWRNEGRPVAGQFEIEYSGEIYVPKKVQKYLFVADDGGFVEIGGKRIIDDKGPHPCKETGGKVLGEPGWKALRVGYYDIGGEAVVRLLREDKPGIFIPVPPAEYRSVPEEGRS